MIVVINAGGSGTRLWPLSTPEVPKHLIQLTGETSLWQNTYARAKRMTDNVYVVTEVSQAAKLQAQTPDLPADHVIIEPARRGTGGCLVSGLARISAHNPGDEPIIFMQCDHQIRDVDTFVNVMRYGAHASQTEKRITIFGLEPTYPSTGLGYIHKGAQLKSVGEDFVYEVQEFKEKPDFDLAQKYVQSGEYLWNMGYFAAPLNVFVEKMRQHGPKIYEYYETLRKLEGNEKAYREAYLAFDNVVIDYELMETSPDLLVVPGTFDWIDIGAFSDLPDVVELDKEGNHFRGPGIEPIEVTNSYIRNEETKPLAVIGLDNVVVVNTPNGVLVTRRDLAQKVGDIAKKLQAEQQQ